MLKQMIFMLEDGGKVVDNIVESFHINYEDLCERSGI